MPVENKTENSASAALGAPALPLHVDSHPYRTIKSPISQVHGWGGLETECASVSAKCQGIDLNMARVTRPDLIALGKVRYFGFSFFLDLPTLGPKLDLASRTLEVQFFGGGKQVGSFTLKVDDGALSGNVEILRNRAVKADFVRRHLRRETRNLAGCVAPSALPDDWPISPRLSDKADPVSSHVYGQVVVDFLNGLGRDAFILDAGAGLRKWPSHNVVNMEIYDYPSTDILAIGQDLPFEDNSFDGAISIAVLEHVDDPFACANELIRVVKPGGKIFAIIPFLQAEHGYPSHFFNATRFGMRKLFEKGTTVEQHFLDVTNHPIFTLHQILGQYAAGLPAAQRERFLDTPVRQFVETKPWRMHQDGHELVANLSEEMSWVLAWGTTAVFVKE